nr:hypothetical protein [Kibdelosporangium sp. MJ126-NF4]CEL22910.1 hypothetical protein [Kibdelosporangium sp. MJ126-NF4]
MRIARILVTGAMGAVLAGCGTGTAPGGTTPPGSSTSFTASFSAAPTPSAVATSRPAPAAGTWTMPNLVGSKLQQAQDTIQKLTGNPLFLTRSHDATGKGRNQVVDSNWKVCGQSVPAGQSFHTDTVIDFAAVKLEEKCG